MSLTYEQAYSKLIFLKLVYSEFQHYQELFHISANTSFAKQIENINFFVSVFEFNVFHHLERKIKDFQPGKVGACEKIVEKNKFLENIFSKIQNLRLLLSDLEEILESPLKLDKNLFRHQISALSLRILNARDKILNLDLKYEKKIQINVESLNFPQIFINKFEIDEFLNKISNIKQTYKDFNTETETIPISLEYLEQKLEYLTRDFGEAIERLDQEDVEKYYKELSSLSDVDFPQPWKRSPENQKFIKKYYSDLF